MNNWSVFSRANRLRESLHSRASAERERRYRARQKAYEAQRVRELFGIDLNVNHALTDSEIDALLKEANVRMEEASVQIDVERLKREIEKLSDEELYRRILLAYQATFSRHVVSFKGRRVRLGGLSFDELKELSNEKNGDWKRAVKDG